MLIKCNNGIQMTLNTELTLVKKDRIAGAGIGSYNFNFTFEISQTAPIHVYAANDGNYDYWVLLSENIHYTVQILVSGGQIYIANQGLIDTLMSTEYPDGTIKFNYLFIQRTEPYNQGTPQPVDYDGSLVELSDDRVVRQTQQLNDRLSYLENITGITFPSGAVLAPNEKGRLVRLAADGQNRFVGARITDYDTGNMIRFEVDATAAGNFTISSYLHVGGYTTISGALTAASGTISGNLSVGGNLVVSGTAQLLTIIGCATATIAQLNSTNITNTANVHTFSLIVDAGLTVGGLSALTVITATTVTVNGITTTTTLDVTGNATVTGSLTASQGIINGPLNVTGVSTLNSITGCVSADLTTINSTTINNSGNITTQNATANGTLTVKGVSTLAGVTATTVTTTGTLTANDLTVTTNGYITGNLTVHGTMTVDGAFLFNNNVTMSKDLTVLGTTYVESIQINQILDIDNLIAWCGFTTYPNFPLAQPGDLLQFAAPSTLNSTNDLVVIPAKSIADINVTKDRLVKGGTTSVSIVDSDVYETTTDVIVDTKNLTVHKSIVPNTFNFTGGVAKFNLTGGTSGQALKIVPALEVGVDWDIIPGVVAGGGGGSISVDLNYYGMGDGLGSLVDANTHETTTNIVMKKNPLIDVTGANGTVQFNLGTATDSQWLKVVSTGVGTFDVVSAALPASAPVLTVTLDTHSMGDGAGGLKDSSIHEDTTNIIMSKYPVVDVTGSTGKVQLNFATVATDQWLKVVSTGLNTFDVVSSALPPSPPIENIDVTQDTFAIGGPSGVGVIDAAMTQSATEIVVGARDLKVTQSITPSTFKFTGAVTQFNLTGGLTGQLLKIVTSSTTGVDFDIVPSTGGGGGNVTAAANMYGMSDGAGSIIDGSLQDTAGEIQVLNSKGITAGHGTFPHIYMGGYHFFANDAQNHDLAWHLDNVQLAHMNVGDYTNVQLYRLNNAVFEIVVRVPAPNIPVITTPVTLNNGPAVWDGFNDIYTDRSVTEDPIISVLGTSISNATFTNIVQVDTFEMDIFSVSPVANTVTISPNDRSLFYVDYNQNINTIQFTEAMNPNRVINIAFKASSVGLMVKWPANWLFPQGQTNFKSIELNWFIVRLQSESDGNIFASFVSLGHYPFGKNMTISAPFYDSGLAIFAGASGTLVRVDPIAQVYDNNIAFCKLVSSQIDSTCYIIANQASDGSGNLNITIDGSSTITTFVHDELINTINITLTAAMSSSDFVWTLWRIPGSYNSQANLPVPAGCYSTVSTIPLLAGHTIIPFSWDSAVSKMFVLPAQSFAAKY
jgi:hypothetical protein